MNESEAALASEVLLFGGIVHSVPGKPSKTLLVKPLSARDPRTTPTCLQGIDSTSDWEIYENYRLQIERAFGLEPIQVRRLVHEKRALADRLSIRWYFYTPASEPVGAIGLLTFPFESITCGRLQDVDVFPSHRGAGHGNALLTAVEQLAMNEGVRLLCVGADTHDWPVAWYRRRGFRAITEVGKVSRRPGNLVSNENG